MLWQQSNLCSKSATALYSSYLSLRVEELQLYPGGQAWLLD